MTMRLQAVQDGPDSHGRAPEQLRLPDQFSLPDNLHLRGPPIQQRLVRPL
jgi:hypothetical protein